MEPLVSLTIRNPKPFFRPGEELLCEYQIDAVGENEITSVEASVLWYTEGKGEEDLGLHYFERRLPSDDDGADLRELKRFGTRMPNSPLSYDGELIKIRWCIRVRVFLPRGKEVFFELPFRLGNLDKPQLRSTQNVDPAAEETSAAEEASGEATSAAGPSDTQPKHESPATDSPLKIESPPDPPVPESGPDADTSPADAPNNGRTQPAESLPTEPSASQEPEVSGDKSPSDAPPAPLRSRGESSHGAGEQ